MKTMRVSSQSAVKSQPNKVSTLQSFEGRDRKIVFDNQVVAKIYDPRHVLTVSNQSNPKVGTAIVLGVNDPEFSDLKILVKDGTKHFKSNVFKVVVDKKSLNNPSFTGHVYGSIGESNYPTEMKSAYREFFLKGMYSDVLYEFQPKETGLRDDYNFFVPTDGDGTRFKDYTNLQGGICKPAAILPAELNERPFKLIHATLSNFAKTGKLEYGANFVEVDRARGSAYAFLEGLKSGKIPSDKPLVFCWGDNFSDINLKKLMKYHEKNNAGLTALGIKASYDRIQSLGGVTINPETGLEIQGFKEKPKANEDIMRSLIPGTDEHLASVGPFVFSKEVLGWLKEQYAENPARFQNDNGEYDFSGKILTPLVSVLSSGDMIVDESGNKLPMMAYIKPEKETWSDLGKTTDLIDEMKAVKLGKYAGLPQEVKASISQNVDLESGVVFKDSRAKDLFERFCKKYGVEIKDANIVVAAA